jgi:hypothetical protein
MLHYYQKGTGISAFAVSLASCFAIPNAFSVFSPSRTFE